MVYFWGSDVKYKNNFRIILKSDAHYITISRRTWNEPWPRKLKKTYDVLIASNLSLLTLIQVYYDLSKQLEYLRSIIISDAFKIIIQWCFKLINITKGSDLNEAVVFLGSYRKEVIYIQVNIVNMYQ